METGQTEKAGQNQLLRLLGIGFGLAVVVGGTIGVSIFRLPGSVAALLGVPWLLILVWTLGGIYTMLGANYTAELATMLPKAGGPYVYAHRAYGPFAGFVVGWSGWLGDVASLAFISIAFGEFAVKLFDLSGGVTIIAAGVLLFLTFLNWLGVRSGSGVQQITAFLKAISLIAFVIACFTLGGGEIVNSAAPVSALTDSWELFVALILAFQLVLAAYGGWNSVVYFAEEDKNPERNIPRSLHGGVLAIIVIYLLVNFALLYVLPFSELAASKLPAADAMSLIFGSRGGQIVTALGMLSIIGILNAIVMYVPRTLYALGRDGLFSTKAMAVNSGGTPVIALAITIGVSILLISIGTFEKLLAIYTFYSVANNILLIASLFVLRRREPDLPRPTRTWGYPFAPIILLLISVGLFIGYIVGDTANSVYALIALAVSYPIYFLVRR